jgi:hypothetical protein
MENVSVTFSTVKFICIILELNLNFSVENPATGRMRYGTAYESIYVCPSVQRRFVVPNLVIVLCYNAWLGEG